MALKRRKVLWLTAVENSIVFFVIQATMPASGSTYPFSTTVDYDIFERLSMTSISNYD